MAVVGPNYQFIYNDVGSNGSLSDGGVFQNCSLFEALENGLLPNNGVIVGDDALPLKTYNMKPYPGRNLAYDEKIYNYRLSRARRISENGFGILINQFQVFEKPIACNVTTVVKIVFTACALHNWLTKISISINRRYRIVYMSYPRLRHVTRIAAMRLGCI